MSEQALKAAPSGTGLATGTATSGTYTALAVGKKHPDAGNALPLVVASKPDIERIAQEMNRAPRPIGNDLRFQVDLERGQAVLQVVDQETGEIIRQIPHEEAAMELSENGSVQIRLLDELV